MQEPAHASAPSIAVPVLLVSEDSARLDALDSVVDALGAPLRRVPPHAAPQAAGSDDYALILIHPPGDGAGALSTLRAIHAERRSSHTPLILLVDQLVTATLEEAYSAGAVDVLAAPFCPAVLRAKISFFLDSYSNAEQARRAGAALAATQARLDTTLAAAELATFEWDIRARLIRADPLLAHLFALTPEEAGGTGPDTYLRRIHPDDLAATCERIRAALDDGAPYDARYRVRAIDGKWRTVISRGKVLHDEAGRAVEMHGVVIDISRQARAEQQLRASEERYRTLFDSVDSGVCVIEMLYDDAGMPADYRFLDVNRAFERHTGLPDAVGKTIRHFVPNHDAHWFEMYGRVAASGVPERRIQQAAGMGRWYDAYAARVGGPGSHQLALLFTDITERVAADAELRRLADDLAEADRRKTEFLATLAHELRNPLAPLRSGLQVLRMASDNPAARARVQDVMDRQLNHMVALVDDLLDVARITRGQIDLKPAWLDLRTLLEAAIEASMPMIEAEGHRLELDLPPEPVTLFADPTRIRQVFANLLANAAKYTPRAGRIALAVVHDAGQVQVTVSDNGVGIPAESLDEVFDMFTQVGGRGASGGGLGIGLSLVRSLVAQHGGSVSAASPGPGQGSTFTVRLPLAALGAAALPDHPVGPAGSVDGLRVMVVDDNCDAADTLAQLLSLHGHSVRTANDGLAALELAGQFLPQVMFLDIGMPGMDGYALARALRADPRHTACMLVALTGWGAAEDRLRTFDAGFDLHLTKPVDLGTVERALALCREQQRAA